MTFDAIWQQLERKQPRLRRDCRIEFTSGNLRALLRQVYEQGQKSTSASSDKTTTAFRDIFGAMGL